MTIKVASRKAKGRKFQKQIAEEISKVLGIPVTKDGDIESRPMSQSGPDIILRGKALKLFPFSVECKHQETWSIPAWMKQVKENQLEGTDWLLVCKKNRENPVVIMDAEAFFRLCKKLLCEGE